MFRLLAVAVANVGVIVYQNLKSSYLRQKIIKQNSFERLDSY
jgi:hypothetical protein